jgi:hypothetical protein
MHSISFNTQPLLITKASKLIGLEHLYFNVFSKLICLERLYFNVFVVYSKRLLLSICLGHRKSLDFLLKLSDFMSN